MPTRLIHSLGFITIASLLSFSIYLQMYEGFEPCPLCSLQRITFGLLGLLFLAGAIVSKRCGQTIIHYLLGLTSLLGVFFAGRQIWLQHFPSTDSNECGVSIQYMMQVLPFNEVVRKIFAGSAECAKAGWEFLYLNMAEWSLIWFVGFLTLSIYLIVRRSNK